MSAGANALPPCLPSSEWRSAATPPGLRVGEVGVSPSPERSGPLRNASTRLSSAAIISSRVRFAASAAMRRLSASVRSRKRSCSRCCRLSCSSCDSSPACASRSGASPRRSRQASIGLKPGCGGNTVRRSGRFCIMTLKVSAESVKVSSPSMATIVVPFSMPMFAAQLQLSTASTNTGPGGVLRKMMPNFLSLTVATTSCASASRAPAAGAPFCEGSICKLKGLLLICTLKALADIDINSISLITVILLPVRMP
mmetsp:Transcript_145850/g.254452  ORF Transcript_145850/g.254452 Transcript_145850/m.254452 type:complete len:254 (-) Transcript_145850:1330-2091(-)